MFYEDDIDVFLADFGVSATFTHTGGTPAVIDVIFDDAYKVLQMMGDMQVESTSPTATCRTADVSNASHGDTLTIGSTTYYVTGPPQHDGTGITILFLSKDQ